MAVGGTLPQESDRARLEKAFKGAKQGTWLILAGLLAAFFVGILTAIEEELAPLFFFPTLFVIVGFLRTVYGIFMQGRAAKQMGPSNMSTAVAAAQAPQMLPPGYGRVDSFMPPRATAEVIHRSSVTENTTKLLEEEGNSPHR